MNSLLLAFLTGLLVTSTAAFGGEDSRCRSGLPAQMFIDCAVAEGAAHCSENGPGNVGAGFYNVTDNLQPWMELQMRRDVARDLSDSTGSDVAQQLDGH